MDLTDLRQFSSGFPHEVFAELRREAPVYFHEPTEHTPGGEGFWVLSRYSDVLAAAKNAELFSSELGGRTAGGTMIEDLPAGSIVGVLLNMTDNPRHREIRQLISPAFARRAMAEVEEQLAGRAAAVVAEAVADRECDFVTRIANELPLQAIAGLLEVPESDRHKLFSWMNAALDYKDRDLGQASETSQQGQAELMAYGAELMAARRADPGEDVLSMAVRGLAGGRALSEAEQLMVFAVFMVAGSETTRNALAVGLLAMIQHPEQWQALRADRALLPDAIEEMLRWSSPTPYNRRTATEDTEIGGHPVRAGEKVTLWWASANRDEQVFAEPSTFDIRRRPNPHVSFGYGGHFCLGAPLTRIEMRLVFDELLDRVAEVQLDGEVEWSRSNKHTGLRHMPVTMRPLG